MMIPDEGGGAGPGPIQLTNEEAEAIANQAVLDAESQMLDETFAERLAREEAVVEENYTVFQHNGVQRFQIGPFEFRSGRLKVPDSQLDSFYDHYKLLDGVDRVLIREVEDRQETSWAVGSRSRVIRGAADSGALKGQEVEAVGRVAPANTGRSPAFPPGLKLGGR